MANSNDSIVMAISLLLLATLMLVSGVQAQNNTTSTYSTPAPTATPTDASSSANTLTSTVALFGALIAVSFAMTIIDVTLSRVFSNPHNSAGRRIFVIKHATVIVGGETLVDHEPHDDTNKRKASKPV